jgi:hypothetical protein
MLKLEETLSTVEVLDKLAVRVTDPMGAELCGAATLLKRFLENLSEQLAAKEESEGDTEE